MRRGGFTSAIAATSASRCSISAASSSRSGRISARRGAFFVKGDRLYVVDGTESNCLYIASIKDGAVIERIDGLKNPAAHRRREGRDLHRPRSTANVRKLVKTK